MPLIGLTAAPHPAANSIVLSWRNPDPPEFDDVRVRRGADEYPGGPDDGVAVPVDPGSTRAVDSGLHGETVYYYALFPFTGSPPRFEVDERNRVAALATSPFDHAGQMMRLLPELYRRYDTRGQLARLLQLPGAQLDQLRSLAQALLDQHDPDLAHGTLLPLLAHAVGWQLDLSVGLAGRRAELRAAPALYSSTGLVPTLEATVKRILGRENRTKEYGANVAHATAPERQTLWARRRTGPGAGSWTEPERPLSIDTAHHGRPAAVRDAAGAQWLIYHAMRGRRPQIQVKRAPDANGAFGPSEPLSPSGTHQLQPSAVAQGSTVWAFWAAHDPGADHWEIRYRTHDGTAWSGDVVFGQPGPERRRPAAAADDTGGVWLFWQERRATAWITRYARHDGTDWSAPVSFPVDPTAQPADRFPVLEQDTAAIGGAPGSSARLWLFWARRRSGPAGAGRWTIEFRTKSTLAPDDSGWSAVTAFATGPGPDEREPAPVVVAGRMELFLATNRAGGWGIGHSTFTEPAGPWAPVDLITGGSPFTERGPAALAADPSGLWLFSRSNRALSQRSEVYGATTIVDRRYSGSTTVDTRNTAKLAQRDGLDDIATYTYATGRGGRPTDADRYAYDAVGVFLDPTIALPEKAGRSDQLGQVKQGLREFLPIHTRVILIDAT